MFDKSLIWYLTLALIIVGGALIATTVWLQVRLHLTKLIHNRFTSARSALEASHERELKELTYKFELQHNTYEKGILLVIAEGVTDEERKEYEERIFRSRVSRDMVIAEKKAEHAKEHRELELSFGY